MKMQPRSRNVFFTDMWALALLAPMILVPILTTNQYYYSLANQALIGLVAALSVYIMLRMDLLSFAVPAFMAIGGYAAAIAAKGGNTNLLLLMALSFAAPALVALPLGALVLRLKGVYFVLVTFVFNEILQLALFETPKLSGGFCPCDLCLQRNTAAGAVRDAQAERRLQRYLWRSLGHAFGHGPGN